MYNVYSIFGFQQGENIGITSSTCRHYTLINSIMCSDSYPIPISSLFFLYHPYIPYFLIQRIFNFLVSFLFSLHACMYSHQVSNSNSGLAPKIGLLLGQSWMAIPMNKHSPGISLLYLFNSKNFSFSNLLPLFTAACMYSHQASNSNGWYHVICKSISPL